MVYQERLVRMYPKISIVIPAHNEQDCIGEVLQKLINALKREVKEYEIIVVDDNSSDKTSLIVSDFIKDNPCVKLISRRGKPGFGLAVASGIEKSSGNAIVIYMGDDSDDPNDVVLYYNKLLEGYDCVFGSRFISGSVVKNYPPIKLIVNRLANYFVKFLFRIKCNDVTNAFKAYSREAINAAMPFNAKYFNITVELPLKAYNRGFSYCVVPIKWYGRRSGVSKLSIREMGRKYLFTVLYLWLERILLSDELDIKRTRKN